MDELIFEDTPQEGTPDNSAEFFIGTVTAWNTGTGAIIKLDGQDAASAKSYKVLQTSRPLFTNRRYLIMKQSGTYIVLGEIGMPTKWTRVATIASSSELSSVINTLNTVILALRDQGILYPPT